ncbi:MAG: hypothetical protein KJ793_02540 [Candidatus Omnitrophica bacterium]|nr:hypothetical protein [Candidatus Omnitrophota bacterium]
MQVDALVTIILLFLLVFSFDISFNLRRLNKSLDRLWRKLVEINDTLQNK